MIEVRRYATKAGKEAFSVWFDGLMDRIAKAKIADRIDRIEAGNFGDCKPLGGGLFELRSITDRDIAFTTP